MAQKKRIDQRQKIINSALKLIPQKGWTALDLKDVAKASKVPLADLKKLFPTKNHILIGFSNKIDDSLASICNEDYEGIPAKDRIFDVMMERFDLLNEYRDGLSVIAKDLLQTPGTALSGLPHLGRSMSRMLEIAQIKNPTCPIKVFGLSGIYLMSLRVWINDDTPDQSKTMAALDSRLTQAEEFMNMIPRFPAQTVESASN